MSIAPSRGAIRGCLACSRTPCAPSTLSLASSRHSFRSSLSFSSSFSTSPSPSSSASNIKLTPSQACAQLVSSRDHASSLAAHFYPDHLRPHFLAIRAFNIETASVKENVSNPTLGRIRVGWWRDAVRGAFDNKATQHPTVQALRDAIHDPHVLASGGLMEDHFIRIIDARENDVLAPATSPLLTDVESYAEGTASRLQYLSLNLLGVSNSSIDQIFSHLGKAIGLTTLLSAFPFSAGFGTAAGPGLEPGKVTAGGAAAGAETRTAAGTQVGQDIGKAESISSLGKGSIAPPTIPQSGAASRSSISASQRRISLPREYLHKHGVVEEEVYRLGPEAKGLRDAAFETATRANDYIISARKEIEGLPGQRMPEELLGVLLNSVNSVLFLRQLEKVDFDLFHPSLPQVASGRGWRLPWEMWKVRRRGKV